MTWKTSVHERRTADNGLRLRMGPRWRRRSWSDPLLLLIYGILLLYALMGLMPIYWTYVTAFKPSKIFFEFPPSLYPKNPTLENFEFIFARTPAWRWIFNTAFVAASVTFCNCFLSSLAGYGFAKKQFRGRNTLFWIVLATMMIPWQVTIVPLFIMINELNWIDTYWGLIVPQMVGAFGIFLMKQFMQTLPSELIDAAKIDGCSEFGVYWRIIVPVSVPAFAVLAIFTFMNMWNAFLWPLLMTSSDVMRTLAVGLAGLRDRFWTEYGIVMAGAALSATPMIILFLALQKYFSKGMTIGAIKG